MNGFYDMSVIKKNTKEYFSPFRIPSGCAVFGVINEAGERFSGKMVMNGISKGRYHTDY